MQYLARFAPDGDGFVVTFPDFPEANTGGANEIEALDNAGEALELTVLSYVKEGRTLPQPTALPQRGGGYHLVSVSAYAHAKIALIEAFRASGISRAALAARLGKGETEVRRMLDPLHATKLSSIEQALALLGKRLVLRVVDTAA